MSGTCPASTPSPPSPTLTLTPIPPPSTPPSWPFSLPTIFSTPSLDSVRALPAIPTVMLLSIATLFMTTILLLWKSYRNRSRTRRSTVEQLRRQLEEASAKQAEYEVQLEQEQEASRRREEEKRWAQEEKRKAEEARKRVVEEKRRVEEEARALKGRLEEKEKQKALLQVGILKLKRKAENVGLELDDAKREVERRIEQLEGLVKQAAPFLELLRIDLDIDLPSAARSPGSPLPSGSTAVQARASSASHPKHETDPDELLPKSLLTSLNNHISTLSAKLADEGVRVTREVEDALDDADGWVNAMHREEALSMEEGSELEVDSDKDRDRGSPRQGRRASPQRLPREVEHQQRSSKQVRANQVLSQVPVLVPTSVYFPPTERRLMDSPRSLHEVELPPVGPPPRGPLPPIPPSPPRAPLPPPKPSSIPRPLSSTSDSRMRAPSSASSQPRPFSAPVQSSPPSHQRASPPPSLPLSAPVLQKPPRTTPPDLQQPPPTQYMYPYPYSNQQQPMGIPVSLARGFASSATASARQSPSAVPLVLSGSTSTHKSSSPPSRSSSAASVLVPFPSSSSGSVPGARPSSISGAQWDKLGPYDRQVLLQAQREREDREREARLEARRLVKLQARRERQAEREARRQEREAVKVENEKRRKEEQGKREEAVEARVQAGEVFGEGLVGMLKESGVRRGVFTERVERKASTPTPKASLSGGKREDSGEGSSGESGSGNGNGNGNALPHETGKEEEAKDRAKEEDKEARGKTKIDLHATLKLAFQTALCAYTHWMMCSWFFEDERGGVAAGNGTGDGGDHEGGEGLEGLLGEVYARVREGEEQLVSGLWRALTRKHVQRMLPGASSGSSSKRNSKDSERQKKPVGGGDGGQSEEEDDGQPDTLIEELCIYIIDALVNVLIVAGAHGGWYVGSREEDSSEEEVEEVSEEGEEDENDDDEDDESEEEILVFPTHQHPSQHAPPRPTPQQLVPTDESGSGGGDYNSDSINLDSDLYHDPYQGYSISQLSEFLSVTPTADTFKIGGRRGQTSQPLTGYVLLQPHPSQVQSSNRPYTRSQSQSHSHLPPSHLSNTQQPQRTSVPLNNRPRPRRSRSATRLQAHFESTSKYTQEYLHAELTNMFKAPLMRILKKARVLNKVLGEEVVRCDLEALYVAPGVGYVGDMMERGKVEQVSNLADEDDEQGKKGKETSKADVDVDANDDGEDTPRPGSSPSSKKGPGSGKGSSQGGSPQGASSRETPGERESPPQAHLLQSQGGSPSRADRESKVELEKGSDDAEILCTTQLGLVRAEKVARTRGEWDEVVLLKPVVVLVRDVT